MDASAFAPEELQAIRPLKRCRTTPRGRKRLVASEIRELKRRVLEGVTRPMRMLTNESRMALDELGHPLFDVSERKHSVTWPPDLASFQDVDPFVVRETFRSLCVQAARRRKCLVAFNRDLVYFYEGEQT